MISLAQFSPVELSLPEKFAEFRPAQIEAIEQVVNSERRFQALSLPTGSGKTLIGMAIAKSLGVRAVVLTSTLGLQQQYLKDFAEIGLVDIRGKRNYSCKPPFNYYDCRFGPHEGCALKLSCTYEENRLQAKRSDLVITNYAYWIRANKHQPGLELTAKEAFLVSRAPNPFELLILDEAHKAVEELSKALQLSIQEPWLRDCGFSTAFGDDPREWAAFAIENSEPLALMLRAYKLDHQKKRSAQTRRRLYSAEHLFDALEALTDISPADWICDLRLGTSRGKLWTLDPIWPGNWSEKLFRGIPKVVFMSATMRPMVMKMMKVSSDNYDFAEWPRVFPARNTPIYHLKTARMNFRASQEDVDLWVRRIDEIIAGRLDRKGLVHTVSYTRQQYLVAHSRFARLMVCNTQDPDSETAGEVIDRFKRMDSPAILVSPSYSTGWDFPGSDCEYQIITKIPFPDARGKLMKARLDRNPLYGNYLAMQDLVQACGRGTRSFDDKCEVFIVDDNISWFVYRNRALAPRWFEFVTISEAPPAPKKIAV